MKTIFISAEEQLYEMEEIHCNTGATVIEAIRGEMATSFRLAHGEKAQIEYEALTKENLLSFQRFMHEQED